MPDLPDSPAQRHYVQALYHLTKTLDPTRPVIGNDGWESVATDIIGIHDYDDDPARIAKRYLMRRDSAAVQAGAAGRAAAAAGRAGAGAADHADGVRRHRIFAGCSGEPGATRAARAKTISRKRYLNLLKVVRSLPVLAGFCYTQFADTYQEANGLLYADRTPKFPIEHIALATRGPRTKTRFPDGMGVARAADEPSTAAIHAFRPKTIKRRMIPGKRARSVPSGWLASNAPARSIRRACGWI